MKDRTWLVKLERYDKNWITLYDDANVLTYGRKKTYVLKKAAMEMVQELISEYSADDSTADFDHKKSRLFTSAC